MPASTCPGIGPGPASIVRSRAPGARHAASAAVPAVANWLAGSVLSLNDAGFAGDRCSHAGDDADLMLQQVADRPLRARGLVVELVGPHPRDHALRVVERLVECIDDVHRSPIYVR